MHLLTAVFGALLTLAPLAYAHPPRATCATSVVTITETVTVERASTTSTHYSDTPYGPPGNQGTTSTSLSTSNTLTSSLSQSLSSSASCGASPSSQQSSSSTTGETSSSSVVSTRSRTRTNTRTDSSSISSSATSSSATSSNTRTRTRTTISSSSVPSNTQTRTTSSSSASSSTPTPRCTPPPGAPNDGVLRGVNIGGWLLLEKWLSPTLFENTTAVDQYTFDQTNSSDAKLQRHWDTFFTEDDVAKLACYGFNALRIPIGFWAYNTYNTPYHPGADAYLERALSWARLYNMRVLIDLHGAPGSQNGFDNSGRAGEIEWQTPQNLARTTDVLKTMARKYTSDEFLDVVFAIELINEPASWEPNDFEVTQRWAQDAYNALAPILEGSDVQIIMHDSFRNEEPWVDIATSLNDRSKSEGTPTFALDVHRYQFEPEDNLLDQAGHIRKACSWANGLSTFTSQNLPIYVGEWTAASNICAYFNGTTTTPGTMCSEPLCQCENVPVEYWFPWLVEQARMYVEAQLDAFHRESSGWFFWNFRGDAGAWSLEEGIEKGVFPNPVWARRYPRICEDM